MVLCLDEKSQVQALDRTQPSLPMKKGRAGTMTHDYKRNGTTTLFAALNVLTGVVIGQCLPRHRHEEFLKFLRTIDNQVPKHLAVHLILDNYATHNHADVQTWLDRHQRFHLHFTPTSSSWLNLVERWFRELTDKAIRRGSFNSVPDLITAIEDYLDAHNHDPNPSSGPPPRNRSWKRSAAAAPSRLAVLKRTPRGCAKKRKVPSRTPFFASVVAARQTLNSPHRGPPRYSRRQAEKPCRRQGNESSCHRP